MLPNLPFMAMRNFESVVRLRGFARAAEELGVTQSSVSQHVKALEEWIGHTLLVRGARNTMATKQGQLLADAISSGIGQISEQCEKLRSKRSADQTITVSCAPGFAVTWLFPRLIKFDQLHPHMPVSISTDTSSAQFAPGQADMAILYGMGNYSGLHVERLMGERVFPVCAPSLLTDDPPLRDISDMAHHTLLVDELNYAIGDPPSWSFWAEQTGQSLPIPAHTRRFGQSNMVVQAAVLGQGVAMGRDPVVADAMQNGCLVQPFPGFAASNYAYWFVCPKGALKTERVRSFRDWLFREQAETYLAELR